MLAFFPNSQSPCRELYHVTTKVVTKTSGRSGNISHSIYSRGVIPHSEYKERPSVRTNATSEKEFRNASNPDLCHQLQ